MIIIRWLAETSEKVTHHQDIGKLRWLDRFLGGLMLDEITLDVIDRIKSERLKTVNKPTVNRYLALVRAILLRARDEWEMDRQDAEGEDVQGTPWAGALDHRGASPDASW